MASVKRARKRTKKPKLLKDGSLAESEIQAQVLAWLETTGLMFWRQNSGTVFVGRRKISLGKNGLPDIVIVLSGGARMIAMELKSKKGSLRPDQKLFRTKFTSLGGTYLLARSLEQAQSLLINTIGEKQWKEWLESPLAQIKW